VYGRHNSSESFFKFLKTITAIACHNVRRRNFLVPNICNIQEFVDSTKQCTFDEPTKCVTSHKESENTRQTLNPKPLEFWPTPTQASKLPLPCKKVASWQGKLLDGTLKNKSLNLAIIIEKKAQVHDEKRSSQIEAMSQQIRVCSLRWSSPGWVQALLCRHRNNLEQSCGKMTATKAT
jgi:hypothetical protein